MVNRRTTSRPAFPKLTLCKADCVFPTRTARFGVALTFSGPLNLSTAPLAPPHARIALTRRHAAELRKHATDLRPIDDDCPCPTCRDGVSRAILHHTVTRETAAAHGP